MSSTRPREGRGIRNNAGGDHDRLKRAVLQPVQCWDKKWAESKNGKGLQVFKWVKSERQVDFDDDEEDEEIEQAPVPRLEVGTPTPALPTLQDADETNASTPMPAGEDDDDEDQAASSQSFAEHEKKGSTSHSSVIKPASAIRPRPDLVDDDDADSSRLVFTPSLETPVETQANTPQDFESLSPAPVELDDLKREAQVELVVKGLDEGQAEMEEEMEDVVVKEKEHAHPGNEDRTNLEVNSTVAPADDNDNSMDVDSNL
ncbi:hypothetical protein BGZ83_006101 [Gryganskiella cystojenkinii]|nr:hypothetical protein BGZ83_006101 [Gryganskiella cystojenkinii]